jgi:hypothetical protein
MPARPPWHANAAQIRRDLEKLPIPVLDRAAIELLFSVERRTAQRLLRTLDGHVCSQVAVVTREAVAAMLDRHLSGKPARTEVARKERLADALAALAHEAIPRTTPIAAIAAPPSGDAWPEGVSISAQGLLQIRFQNPEDLLGRILALTEQAAGDYPGFAQRLARETSMERDA